PSDVATGVDPGDERLPVATAFAVEVPGQCPFVRADRFGVGRETEAARELTGQEGVARLAGEEAVGSFDRTRPGLAEQSEGPDVLALLIVRSDEQPAPRAVADPFREDGALRAGDSRCVVHLVRRAGRNAEFQVALSVEPDAFAAGSPEPRFVGTSKVERIGLWDVPGRGAEAVARRAGHRRREARHERQRARQHRPSPAVAPHAPES